MILLREDVATSDIAALEAAAGLVAARGARTSHAAVVARQLGKASSSAARASRSTPTAGPGALARGGSPRVSR